MPSILQDVVSKNDIQEKLRLLEIEKAQLESRLLQLQADIEQQQLLLTRRSEYNLGPINRLPPEILLHIFFFYITLDDDDPEMLLKLDLRPVTISHVCQEWRQIALFASDLWTCLVFNKPSAVSTLVLRSKDHPVDVIHASQSGPYTSSPEELYRPLTRTRTRWRNVFWEASEERTRNLLLALNYEKTTFSQLHTLDIRVQARNSPCKPILLQTFGSVRFPALSRLFLSGISPSEIPPATAHVLRLLHIHFPISYPYPSNPLLPPYFRMSSLCAYLMQASQLETFVLEDCTPLMDVYLHPSPGQYAPIKSSSISAIRAILPTSAVPLPKLRRLDWTSAPPKDLWRLFHFLDTPELVRMDLSLGKADHRWFIVHERTISPMPSSHPLSLHPVNLLLRFEMLRELRVSCCDADGLSLALRKMHFPSLERLELSYVGVSATCLPHVRSTSIPSPPKLSPLESMFREPRLVKLTHFMISGFALNMSVITAMLAYMPALLELCLDSCKGMDQNPGHPEGTHDSNGSAVKRWTCAHLERMTVQHCLNLRFRWLEGLLAARRHSPDGPDNTERRLIRPLPSLRKTALANVQGTSSNPAGPSTPRRPRAAQNTRDSYPSMSSPNGSFVVGWNPHEPVQPVKTMTLCIEDCRRISEAEGMSLQDRKYGVTNVVWNA